MIAFISAHRRHVLVSVLCVATTFAASARAQSTSSLTAQAQRDLSLTWVAPQAPGAHVTALVLSGDGGWAQLIADVADGLAAHGVGVVGVNSRRWLASPKTPDATAAAAAWAIAAARAKWPADRLLIVGYSRGADMAPFIATRLPAPLASQLAGVAMFGLAPMASFEFHMIDLVKDTRRDTDVPLIPELEKLRGTPMVCVYGSDEPTSGCRDAPDGLLTKVVRPGGHHFDRNADVLVQQVMSLLSHR